MIIKDQTKSDRQRNQFHALCADISRITGYTPAEIKNLIKQDFLGFADVKIAGKMRRVLKSSEDLDRGDYSKLIEYVDLWRSNNGI